MEHLQISGSIRVFHTSEKQQMLDQLLQVISGTKLENGYLHVTTFVFKRLYLGIDINADAEVSTTTDIRQALKEIGSLMTLDSRIMMFQPTYDLWAWQVVLR